MLVDYDIQRNEPKNKMNGLIPFAQFVLSIIFIQCLLLMFSSSSTSQIEEETLRYRILANSNSVSDQQLKLEIQKSIQPLLNSAITTSNVDEINSNLIEIEEEVRNIASQIALRQGHEITFERTNALFPPKQYEGVLYSQNYYDAYVLTIGSGRGDNFWCALFPNVCYPEQKSEEKVETEEKPKFFVWEWFKKIFS